MSELHLIVPDDIYDPARPSGGNTYDRRLCRGLEALGWEVREHAVAVADRGALAGAVRAVPDGAVVLLDGLLASGAPEVLLPEAERVRQVVLVHMPLGVGAADEEARTREHRVLAAAAAVVTTSAWTQRRLFELYDLPFDRVHVAEPGGDRADLARGGAAGGALLCVAAITPAKGHDVLLDALASSADLRWRCECVGSVVRDPAAAEAMRRRALDLGLAERVRFAGPLVGPDLDAAYAAADLLVLPSRAETYGMVVTEALARGVPVVATDVGGVTEALGHGSDGTRPGLLVPSGDPSALAAALRRWLTEAELRAQLRRAARERRETLRDWPETTAVVSAVLERVGATIAGVAA